MIEKSIIRLAYLVENIPSILSEISEEKMSEKTSPNKWSKKEIIGHLIDSATNNHQRFIRGQFEPIPAIRYDQNKWNEYNFYQELSSKEIIKFWTIYNQHLVEITNRIPIENLSKQIKVGDELFTLEFLIIYYVEHLEHHLRQVVAY
jgi:hypothetical protein